MIDVGSSLGLSIEETVLKKGLRELNSGIHFDVGGNLNIAHPMMNIRQGVFHNGRFLATMDRGSIPEYKVWAMQKQRYFDEDGNLQESMHRTHVIRIGWQHLFDRLIRRKIPGITRESLSKKFNLPVKFHLGGAGIQSIEYGRDIA